MARQAPRNPAGSSDAQNLPNPAVPPDAAPEGGMSPAVEQLDLSRPKVLAQVQKVGNIPGIFHPTDGLYAAREELQARLRRIPSPMPAREDPSVPNIKGVAIGLKFSSGRPTGELVLAVIVVKKFPESKVPRESLIPDRINGFATDVYECGIHRPHGLGRVSRPIPCGSEIGTATLAGTLGCLVIAGNKLCILSNNHVLAGPNDGQDGDQILQPAGGQPASGQNTGDLVGTLIGNYPQLDFNGGDNIVDAALAHTSWSDSFDVADPTFDDGTVMNPQAIAPAVGMSVHKFGETTGHTFGTIIHTDFPTTVDYTQEGKGFANFTGQINILGQFGGIFSQGGDSGSLILTQGTNQPVALLIGGDAQVGSIATPLEPIIQALKIQKFVAVKF
jgi:hypothetical protein